MCVCVCVLERSVDLYSKQERFVCYVRQVLLHCCETLELTVADEATLHRVEHCMIYIYMCVFSDFENIAHC